MAPMVKEPEAKNVVWEAAKKYVDEQLETMKRFGSAPNLSHEAYEALVRKVAEAAK